MTTSRHPAGFSRRLYVAVALLILLAVSFLLHIRSDRQISRAYAIRHESYLLADELRQSSDDLTRMVRLYVVTGDSIYKRFFEEILDVREGLKPRPINFHRINWDSVLADGKQPSRESTQAISLAKLMQQAGFTDDELRKLEEAKARSDDLTAVEFEAMKLVERGNPDDEANRAKATVMLTDETYRKAKAGIMQPIDEFCDMLDYRTLAAVKSAERTATIMDYTFAAVLVALTSALSLTYVRLQNILGGRHESESVNRRLAAIVNSTDDAVISKSLDGIITSWNPGAERIFGFTSREAVGSPMTMLFPPDLLDEEKRILTLVSQDIRIEPFETVRRHAEDRLVHVSVSISPVKDADERIVGATTIARDITDRKQAERALRESNERLQALALATSEIIWSTDSNGQVNGPLGKWQKYTGQSNEEIQGGGWVNAVHPEDSDRAMAAWRKALEAKSLYSTDYRLRRHDGLYRQFLVHGVPVLKPDGTIREWIGTCVDVEDLTIANKSRDESEERLRLSLDAAQMGTFDWDVTTDRIVWSKWHHILWNYTPGEFNGTFDAFAQRVHPEDMARISTEIDRSVASQSRFECVFRVVWPDCSIHWVDSTGQFEFGSDGKPLRMLGTVVEITDRKQAEFERDRFFTLSLEPLCIADTNGYFRRLNPAFKRILGFSAEEMLSRPFLDFIHPDDLPATMKVVESLASGIELVNFENRYLCKDGSHRWFTWTCAPYAEEGLLYASAHDITERKRAEVEILTLNCELEDRVRIRTSELEASNKELEAFSYSVSHDLRAPLRSVDSFSRIAIEDYGPQLGDEGMRVLNIVRSEAQRMGQLIDDLLSFSRFGRQEVHAASIDMEELARNVYDALSVESRLHVKQLTIEAIPPAFGDRAMLRQVWYNLISNAVKFTKSQPEAAIVITGESIGGMNRYKVKDNGAGFDSRYKHKLFGVFQRLHSEEEFEGTGVGLALVQRIIYRHGGKVEAEGLPNRGAMFTFSLPIQEKI